MLVERDVESSEETVHRPFLDQVDSVGTTGFEPATGTVLDGPRDARLWQRIVLDTDLWGDDECVHESS
jgi:hypothetical protein